MSITHQKIQSTCILNVHIFWIICISLGFMKGMVLEEYGTTFYLCFCFVLVLQEEKTNFCSQILCSFVLHHIFINMLYWNRLWTKYCIVCIIEKYTVIPRTKSEIILNFKYLKFYNGFVFFLCKGRGCHNRI